MQRETSCFPTTLQDGFQAIDAHSASWCRCQHMAVLALICSSPYRACEHSKVLTLPKANGLKSLALSCMTPPRVRRCWIRALHEDWFLLAAPRLDLHGLNLTNYLWMFGFGVGIRGAGICPFFAVRVISCGQFTHLLSTVSSTTHPRPHMIAPQYHYLTE